jgi:hypothetical protein
LGVPLIMVPEHITRSNTDFRGVVDSGSGERREIDGARRGVAGVFSGGRGGGGWGRLAVGLRLGCGEGDG